MKARLTGLVVGLLACSANAHPEGFHPRYVFTLTRTGLTALLVMDVDSGERCELLRAGADANHDGLLSSGEKKALEKKLTSFVLRPLKVGVSSAPIPLVPAEMKLNLRNDSSVSRAGMSVALLIEVKHPWEVSPGMHFELETTTPDQGPLRLEVFQLPAPGADAEPRFAEDIPSGKKVRVRLGHLGKEAPAR